jgi:hypothetical protein
LLAGNLSTSSVLTSEFSSAVEVASGSLSLEFFSYVTTEEIIASTETASLSKGKRPVFAELWHTVVG